MAEVMLNFGTQITSNIMSMAEASRQEAARREELLRQEALAIEKEKLAFAREQMLAQMRKDAEEANAKREEQLLENEHKRHSQKGKRKTGIAGTERE